MVESGDMIIACRFPKAFSGSSVNLFHTLLFAVFISYSG
jgi:hypothetical protein